MWGKSMVLKAGLLCFPFSLPLPIPLIFKSICLGVFCMATIIASEDLKQSWERIYRSPITWLFVLFYIMGPLFTLLREGVFSGDDTRLPFLILPFLIPLAKDSLRSIRIQIENAYLLGVGCYLIYALCFLLYFYGGQFTDRPFGADYYLKYVLYHYLPGAIHHTYLSIFLLFAGVLIWNRNQYRLIQRLWILLLLLVSLPFLGSKWSLLVTFILIVCYSLRNMVQQKRIKVVWPIIFILVGVIALGASSDLFRTLGGSYSDRVQLFQCSIIGISDHILLGIGKGEIKSWMQACSPSGLSMDTHNIFLQELLASGIFGVLLVVAIIGCLFWKSKGNFTFQAFVLLCFLFGLVEHLFNTQLGVTFFTFFTLMFLTWYKNPYTHGQANEIQSAKKV